MRRSDIEVPNLPVDVAFCAHAQSRLYLHLFRGSGVLWRSIDLRYMRGDAISCTLQEVVTGEPRVACRHFAGAARNSRCGEEPSLGIARTNRARVSPI